MSQFLYRGVSSDIHNKKTALQPKGINFEQGVKYGERPYGTFTYGESEKNAVVRHQDDSAIFPTSGVSTTLHLERAKYYALGNGKHQKGYVYKIERSKLKDNSVKEFVVKDYVLTPKIPEDDEIILVSGQSFLAGLYYL